jgi:thiol:disulfide interchange protein
MYYRTLCILRDVWEWYPGVGWYIAILGALGIAVTILRDLTKIRAKEKATWIGVTFILLLLELHSITLDRRQHDREQKEASENQLKEFQAITNQAQQHFEKTANRLESLIQTTQI